MTFASIIPNVLAPVMAIKNVSDKFYFRFFLYIFLEKSSHEFSLFFRGVKCHHTHSILNKLS